MGTISWKRPSGNPIKTNDNDATIKYCVSMGWKKIKKEKAKN